MFVRSRMTVDPIVATPGMTLPEALELMTSNQVRRLPVISGGRLVGVISHSDIADVTPSKATTLSANEAAYLMRRISVEKVMSHKRLIFTTPDSLLEEAATAMRDNQVGFLPVLEGDDLVGVITESAILDAFIDILGLRYEGTRLTIVSVDAPGRLADFTSIPAKYGANIGNLAVYRGDGDESTIVLGLNTFDTEGIEQELLDKGYKIIAKRVLKNS